MMQDSKILHFLRSFPPWIVLVALTGVFVMFYYWTSDNSYKEWASLTLASLFTALGVRATQQPQANVEKVEKMEVNTGGETAIDTPMFHEKGKDEV